MKCNQETAPELRLGPGAGGPLEFELRLPSDPRLLCVVRSAVAKLAAVWGFEEDQCRCITLAVDEALSNVIRHAYANCFDGEVELRCRALPDGLEFTLVDRGEPPDPARICAQARDAISAGGRGTHLIRQIMDEVCYDRVPEGNRLRLKKYFRSARPGA